ncbi:hypothetical protein ACFQGT_11155 [Natrialbaceae archaeon GCM10025810]|uniref:hypothetical protein n=1 Tax=Halovalidus salilacus TaxID=3075124 RepID=UPI00360929AE
MATCETCGEDVSRLWDYHAYEGSMTHRQVRHVCADCHPNLGTHEGPPEDAQAEERDVHAREDESA